MPERREAQIARSIDDVDAAEWDALCPERPFVDHRWLRTIERILPDSERRYVLLRRHGRLDAAAICVLDRRFEHPAAQRHAGWVLRIFPYLRCSVPVSFDDGLLAADARALPELVAAVRQLARAEHALLTTFEHLGPDARAWPALIAAGCHPLSRWTSTYLPIAWSTRADYLMSRSGPDRREIGRLRRRAERQGITLEYGPLQRADAPLLRRLIANVLARHAAHDPYAPDFLTRAADMLGSHLHVLQARLDGETVGCAVMVHSRTELLGKWIGLEYSRTPNSATYQALMLGTIDLAIELGVQRLRLGATAYSTKEQFGAQPDERLNALALPGRAVALAASPVLQALSR
jgi:predicted N-acyltransferase